MGFDETDISIKAGIIKIKELACMLNPHQNLLR
jgi:hypothetical protein